MDFPADLQQEIEKWVSLQKISIEEFILQAVTEKVHWLSQQSPNLPAFPQAESSPSVNRLHDKNGILVLTSAAIVDVDSNTLIDELREDRIQAQMGL